MAYPNPYYESGRPSRRSSDGPFDYTVLEEAMARGDAVVRQTQHNLGDALTGGRGG